MNALDDMSPVAYSMPIMFKFPIDSFRDRVSVLLDLYASTDDPCSDPEFMKSSSNKLLMCEMCELLIQPGDVRGLSHAAYHIICSTALRLRSRELHTLVLCMAGSDYLR